MTLPPDRKLRLEQQTSRGKDEQIRHDPAGHSLAGVESNSPEPTTPPDAVTTAQRRSHDPLPASSGREVNAEPGQQATSATMFVTFAGKRSEADREQGRIGDQRGDTARSADDTGKYSCAQQKRFVGG